MQEKALENMPKKGYKQTELHKKRSSEAHKEQAPWNKGKTGLQIAWNKGTTGLVRPNSGSFKKGHTALEETRRKIGEALRGRVFSKETKKKMSENNARPMLGKHHTEEAKKKIGEVSLKRHAFKSFGFQKNNHPKSEFKKGQVSNRKGAEHTEESKRKMSEANKGRFVGEKHHAWKGGISKEPYSQDWTETLKEAIRQRDNYACQNCGKTQKEELESLGKKLSVHHIDYNKKDCDPKNLIVLCMGCNARANFNRESWKWHFVTKQLFVKKL